MHYDIPRVLSGAVVTARTKEMLWSEQVQAYKGLGMTEPKRRGKSWDSPSIDPLTIATTRIKGMESREQQTPNKRRAQSTSYWINGD
jgi:hypothetical protein